MKNTKFLKFNFEIHILFVLLLSSVSFAANSLSISQQFTSSHLPIIVINTNGQRILDSPRIVADMGIIYNGEGKTNRITDPFNHYNGKIAVELRGSATLRYPKKQLRIETQDSLGNNLNVALLDMPRENDWILYGPWDDQSLIRNVLAYGISNDIGRYASRTKFCELVVNDDYQGLYVLLEKIKRDKYRVNIPEINPNISAGHSLTGGYIIKIDKISGENVGGWYSDYGILYQYHYPKADEINIAQQRYIQQFLNNFETLMAGSDYTDPENGYQKYIDLNSFVDHFILSEVCKNVDAYRISAYMYKMRDSDGGKLFMGPIWDYNLSFGKAWFSEDLFLTAGWQVDYNIHRPADAYHVPFWWEILSRDSVFTARVKYRYNELRKTILHKNSLYQRIDIIANSLSDAVQRNFERWQQSAPNHSYEQEIVIMKNWITLRIDWIDNNIDSLMPNKNKVNETQPMYFVLHQNYPNPFNNSTTVEYRIHTNVQTTLKIYSVTGTEVATLVNEYHDTNPKRVIWNGTDNNGNHVCSGVYVYKLEAGSKIETRKMLFLK